MSWEWVASLATTGLLFPFVGYYFKRVNQAISALEAKSSNHESRLVALETERDIRIALRQVANAGVNGPSTSGAFE